MAYKSRTSTVDRVKLTFSDGSSERLYLRADLITYKLSKTYLTTSVRFEMEIVSNRDSGNNPGAAYLAFYEGDGEPSSAEHFVDMYENYHPVCRTCNTEFSDPCVCQDGYTFVEQNRRIISGAIVSDAYSAYMLGNDSPYDYEPDITTVNTCDKCAPGLFLTQGVQFMTCAFCPAGFYQMKHKQHVQNAQKGMYSPPLVRWSVHNARAIHTPLLSHG